MSGRSHGGTGDGAPAPGHRLGGAGPAAPRPSGIGSVAEAHEAIAAALREGRPSAIILYSRSGTLSNREVLDRGVGLPRSAETVRHYAELAHVDFRGAPIEIVDSADDVAYLDFRGAVARTDALGVQLGPAAFQDEETLVRTLGHESVHVRQHEEGRITTVTDPLEDEAYEAEDGFVAAWRRNRE